MTIPSQLSTPTTQQTCTDGSALDSTGNCPISTTTKQNSALQTLTGLGLPPAPPQPTPNGDGSYQLPTVPAQTNTGTIAPICPSGSHLVGSKCVIDGVSCPSGTDQDGDICKPQLKTTTTPAGGGGTTTPAQPTPLGDGSFQLPTVTPDPRSGGDILLCPSGSHVANSKCVIDGVSCPSGTDQDGDICKPQLKTTTGTPAGGGGTTTTGTPGTTTEKPVPIVIPQAFPKGTLANCPPQTHLSG
jgi:hypothetical protein